MDPRRSIASLKRVRVDRARRRVSSGVEKPSICSVAALYRLAHHVRAGPHGDAESREAGAETLALVVLQAPFLPAY